MHDEAVFHQGFDHRSVRHFDGNANDTRVRPGLPILVVDDDPKTLRYVRDALADSEYAPLVTRVTFMLDLPEWPQVHADRRLAL